jgi:hypothetical protein
MTGVEEDLFTNRRLMKKGEGTNRVLLRCTKRLGENGKPKMKDILDLLSGNRLFVLVSLRRISPGDEVDLVGLLPIIGRLRSPPAYEDTAASLAGQGVCPRSLSAVPARLLGAPKLCKGPPSCPPRCNG